MTELTGAEERRQWYGDLTRKGARELSDRPVGAVRGQQADHARHWRQFLGKGGDPSKQLDARQSAVRVADRSSTPVLSGMPVHRVEHGAHGATASLLASMQPRRLHGRGAFHRAHDKSAATQPCAKPAPKRQTRP